MFCYRENTNANIPGNNKLALFLAQDYLLQLKFCHDEVVSFWVRWVSNSPRKLF